MRFYIRPLILVKDSNRDQNFGSLDPVNLQWYFELNYNNLPIL